MLNLDSRLVMRPRNKYDKIIIFMISLLSLGVIGGGAQAIRIFSIILLPFNIIYFMRVKHKKRMLFYVAVGVFWMIYAVFTLFWSPDSNSAKIDILYLLIHFNIILSLLRFGKYANRPVESLIIGWCTFVILTLPLALFEIITNDHFYTNEIQTDVMWHKGEINGVVGKRYAAATFNNYNEYVTAIVFALPYLLFALLYFRKNRTQLLFWSVLLLTILLLLTNASRGGIMCLVVDIIIFAWYYRKIKFVGKNNLMTVVSIFLCVILIIYSDSLFEQISGRLSETNMLEDVGRLAIYKRTLSLLVDSGYLGVGPYGIQAIIGLAPHNLWLEILVQYGIVVFVLCLVILMLILYKCFQKFKGTVIMFPIVAIFVSLPFASIINHGYLNFPFFWMSVGSVLLLREIPKGKYTI